MKLLVVTLIATALAAVSVRAAGEDHGHGHGHGQSGEITIQGEVVDVFCYVSHEAKGAGHANCAKTCIESGLPVGILTADGKLYLAAGDHKPMNKELAKHAAQQVKATGKVSSRAGVNLIEVSKLEPVK